MEARGKSAPVQLSLAVSLRDDATFANFYAQSEQDQAIVASMRSIACGEEHHSHMIWGAPGCGITHLMQATCHLGHQSGRAVQYLPLRDLLGYEPSEIFEGLEAQQVVCLDGLELICGERRWEIALFNLFNELRDASHTLLVGAHSSPQALSFSLPDLASRLRGSVIYRVSSLDDDAKRHALTLRAEARGMQMPEDVARFILSRTSRDTHALFYTLDRLDEASIQQQRKLTIPFVKQALGL